MQIAFDVCLLCTSTPQFGTAAVGSKIFIFGGWNGNCSSPPPSPTSRPPRSPSFRVYSALILRRDPSQRWCETANFGARSWMFRNLPRDQLRLTLQSDQSHAGSGERRVISHAGSGERRVISHAGSGERRVISRQDRANRPPMRVRPLARVSIRCELILRREVGRYSPSRASGRRLWTNGHRDWSAP
jgi:hypothetical protein